MGRKPDIVDIVKLKAKFLEQLELIGNTSIAAKKTKISRQTVYNWLKDDPEFKSKYEKSYIIGLDLIDDEIQRRAIHGTKKPVYQGGKRVGYITELSDTLLIFYAKCKKPDIYKDRFEHTGKDGTPLQGTIAPIVNVYNFGPDLKNNEEDVETE